MSIRITSHKGFEFFTKQDFVDLYRYRDLLFMLVKREINVLYKQTVLGFAWAVIKPLAQMIVFTLVFGKLINFQGLMENGMPYAVFSYAALVPWTYFATALTSASGSLIANSSILTKVYFPRIIAPLTSVLAKLLDFCIALVVLVGLLLFYNIEPSINLLYLPLLVLLMITTAFGMSIWLAALSIAYRDVQQLMTFLVQLLMFAAPVIWPVSLIPTEYRFWVGFYPMSGIIEGFRVCLTGIGVMPWDMLLPSTISTVAIFVTGALYFKNKEHKLSDVI
ncbi:ABC transporter permease [soil metagenome]